MFVWDMTDEPFNKVENGQGHGFLDVGIMVKILKGNGITIIMFDSCFTKGRPFEIFTEILYVCLHVI